MPTRTGCLLIAALGCAGGGKRPPAPAAPSPSAAPTCSASSFQGRWIIDSGSATLSCDDGTKTSLAAGGNIVVETDLSGRLFMVDGQCRFSLEQRACTLVGAPGGSCREADAVYVSRKIEIATASAGPLSLSYALEHPDPENPTARCVAGTVGTMVRASPTPDRCPLDGRWATSTLPDGTPGRVSLSIAQGRCVLEAPGLKAEGRCSAKGGILTTDDDACRPPRPGRYALTFAHDCTALELEARDDPCAKRRSAIEYLYFRRQ